MVSAVSASFPPKRKTLSKNEQCWRASSLSFKLLFEKQNNVT